MTAIVEERHAGYSDEDAVTLGLQRSGPVISWVRSVAPPAGRAALALVRTLPLAAPRPAYPT